VVENKQVTYPTIYTPIDVIHSTCDINVTIHMHTQNINIGNARGMNNADWIVDVTGLFSTTTIGCVNFSKLSSRTSEHTSTSTQNFL